MKTASKVFIIIGMILGFYLIAPIIVGILALRKLRYAQNKDELLAMSILSLIFVSPLSGIFMFCIKDDELLENKHKLLIENNKNASNDKKPNKFFNIFYCLGLIILGILSTAAFIFSIIGASKFNGETWVQIFICSIELLLYFILTIVYLYKRKITLFMKIYNVILSILCVLVFVIAILSNNIDWVFQYWGVDYKYGDIWLYWVIMGIGIGMFCISFTISILALCQKNASKISKDNFTDFSNKTTKIELELTQAKKLFDNQVITNQEYERIRNSIISKYYEK